MEGEIIQYPPLPFDKAVVYCRVSTKQQKFGYQEDICLDFCNDKKLNVIGKFKEKVSGSFADEQHRPELYKAINLCKDNKAVLVATRFDRLFRTENVYPLKDVPFIFASEAEIPLTLFISQILLIKKEKKSSSLSLLLEYFEYEYDKNNIEYVKTNGFFQTLKTKDNHYVTTSMDGVVIFNGRK